MLSRDGFLIQNLQKQESFPWEAGDESPTAKLEKSELYAHCWYAFFDSVTIVLKPCAASEVWIDVFPSVCSFGIWVFLLFVLFLIKHVSTTDCHWQDGAFSLISASFYSMTSSPRWLRGTVWSSSDLVCYQRSPCLTCSLVNFTSSLPDSVPSLSLCCFSCFIIATYPCNFLLAVTLELSLPLTRLKYNTLH